MGRSDDSALTTRRSLRAVLAMWAILAGIIVVAASLVALWNVSSTSAGGPEAATSKVARRLETAPQLALDNYFREKDAELNRYEWIDANGGIAAIPLDLAIRSLAARGNRGAESDSSKERSYLENAAGAVLDMIVPKAIGAEQTKAAESTAPASSRGRNMNIPPTAEFTQNLGTDLPLNGWFTDQLGKRRRLGEFFDRQPVVVVLGYYQCPQLCSTVMRGVLQSVQGIDLPYEVVAVSIDPRETAEVAARQYAFYKNDNTGVENLHLLTGQTNDISALTQRAGFAWEYDDASGQYAHPAGFLIATPEGRISRYFPGVRFDRRDVRLALVEASNERIGTLADRIILMCSHYDPLRGRYSLTVMTLLRVLGLALIGGLLIVFWRLHVRRRPGA